MRLESVSVEAMGKLIRTLISLSVATCMLHVLWTTHAAQPDGSIVTCSSQFSCQTLFVCVSVTVWGCLGIRVNGMAAGTYGCDFYGIFMEQCFI